MKEIEDEFNGWKKCHAMQKIYTFTFNMQYKNGKKTDWDQKRQGNVLTVIKGGCETFVSVSGSPCKSQSRLRKMMFVMEGANCSYDDDFLGLLRLDSVLDADCARPRRSQRRRARGGWWSCNGGGSTVAARFPSKGKLGFLEARDDADMGEIEAILEEEVKSQEDGARKGSKRHQEEGKPEAQAIGTKNSTKQITAGRPGDGLDARATDA
ncbi:hypothetical protein V8G54_010301 [Vigna mungo]|uniref:Uncharacterized protein n=1 Tax=Vigna mungo TaxID=3915 RepID=A0AAQ3S2X6_VIGMU